MPFSRCRDVIERVSSILDGEATVRERLAFHGHLAMCGECSRYFAQFRTIHEAAGIVRPEDLPGDFDRVLGSVLAAVREGPFGERS